jgi:hypothetical protein
MFIMKHFKVVMLLAVLVCAGYPVIMFASWGSLTGYWQPIDIYPAGNGDYWVSRVFAFETLLLISTNPTYKPSENQIALIDSSGNTLWSLGGFAIPHSIEPLPTKTGTDLLVADCEHNQVLSIAYPSGTVLWRWQPSLINWTLVNPAWGPKYYYNNPTGPDWTHVNHAEWYNYTKWIGVLISLRNWNLVVVVNYTAELSNPNQASNIVWWYGNYDNDSVLNHQHGATFDSNGNVWIADSDNQRVLAINYTTRTVFWSYQNSLGWVRGADPLPNGDVLISGTSKIIEVTPEKKVVWSYSSGIDNAYASIRLPNGDTVISNNYALDILTVSPTGALVGSIGFPVGFFIPSFIALPFLLLPLVWVAGSPKSTGGFHDRISRRFMMYLICVVCIMILVTVFFQWISTFMEWIPGWPTSWK